jgi:hypothetical protein
MKLIVPAMALLAIGLCWNQAARADTMRCGNQLVSTGATLYEVKSTCGEPDDQQHRVETKTLKQRESVPCDRADDARCSGSVSTTIEIVIDEWTYDFGPNQFIEVLRFENGRLVWIHDGGYGKKAGR